MKTTRMGRFASAGLVAAGMLFSVKPTVTADTFYVDLSSSAPAAPYTNWITAATNIQDAIDVASAGDTVLVTNGVYANGGKVMAGDLTNRIALDKPITVQSVNGPSVTVIQGAYSLSTGYGPLAVRCAWLTNGASLAGFTLVGGATRGSGDPTTLENGAGVWCASSNSLVANCIVASNKAWYYGGGAYQGSFTNCSFTGNSAQSGGGAYSALLALCGVISNKANFGGGAYGGTLRNCTLVGNSAINGGGVSRGVLYNCTVTGNSATTTGGVDNSTAVNCLVYFNAASSSTNFSGGNLSYSCSTPLPPGPGNIALNPQLCGDAVHLTSSSPCRGAGTNSVVSGVDIDGQPWADPPDIGCDEWLPEPVIVLQPRIQLTGYPAGFAINTAIAGSEPFACWWSRNGVPIENDAQYSFAHTTNLTCNSIGQLVGGGYQVVISNAFGMVTSAVAQAAVHCVDAAGTNPASPYSTWATAVTNIQDAVTTALAGEVVLVTSGTYATGGKTMDGVITNRVAVDKAITVQSLTGPEATFIQGNWNPTVTNGASAVRCAWLTNGAVLSGFTLRGGGTRVFTGSPNSSMNGGGVWGASTNAVLFNCRLVTNRASYQGGGAYQATLNNCALAGNHADSSGPPGTVGGTGGGAFGCNLNNSVVTGNFADQDIGGGARNCNLRNCAITGNSSYLQGGGAFGGTLVNCTMSGNISGGYGTYGGAAAGAALTNCIIYGNSIRGIASTQTNYANCTIVYSDSDPLPAGNGNIDLVPQLLPDGVHLAASSPCRGAGTNVVVGTDIDGQAWANPPSMGCDEWQPTPLVAGQLQIQLGGIPLSATFGGFAVSGQAPFAYWWSKDGVLLDDGTVFSSTHSPNLIATAFGPVDAGGYQLVVSNSFGMATSAVGQVTVHVVDAAGSNPMTPFSNWDTAATNIQDAIDAATAGEFVIVTNGLYAAGGKAMTGTLTNRVALTQPLVVASVNGPWSTIIQGAWDPATTNGPLAVRCAWLTNGATLSGFTLQNGATQPYNGYVGSPLASGGGAWCSSMNGVVSNCVLSNNTAIYGGGISYGTLNNSLVVLNVASYGGGAYFAAVNNCTVVRNYTTTPLPFKGAGTYDGITRNSIVLNNYDNYPHGMTEDDYFAQGGPAYYYYSCTSTTPSKYGVGNISASPQFLDWFHIASTSPCCGSGSPLYSAGADLDGEPWNNPPSIGCDEVVLANLVGPLSVALTAPQTNLLVNHYGSFGASITGRASRVEWMFGDGTIVTNTGSSIGHQWTNSGDSFVSCTAYNTDNPSGVSTSLVVHILQPDPPQLQSALMTSNALQFQFAGQASATYYIQFATNLAAPAYWQNLQTIYSSTGGMYQVLDFGAVSNATRFYRVLAQ